jgi:hypothetical protein
LEFQDGGAHHLGDLDARHHCGERIPETTNGACVQL